MGVYPTEVGAYLFSQAASSQVSWAQMGLTAVFGMGTGVPPPPSAPTAYRCPPGYHRIPNDKTQYNTLFSKLQAFYPACPAICPENSASIGFIRSTRLIAPKPDRVFQMMGPDIGLHVFPFVSIPDKPELLPDPLVQ